MPHDNIELLHDKCGSTPHLFSIKKRKDMKHNINPTEIILDEAFSKLDDYLNLAKEKLKNNKQIAKVVFTFAESVYKVER